VRGIEIGGPIGVDVDEDDEGKECAAIAAAVAATVGASGCKYFCSEGSLDEDDEDENGRGKGWMRGRWPPTKTGCGGRESESSDLESLNSWL
jgi:hypothetical protein